MAHHDSHDPMSTPSSGSSENLYLPASILLGALILSIAIGLSAWEIGGKVNSLSTSIKALQVNAQVQGGSGNNQQAQVQPQQPPAPKIDMAKLSQGYPTFGDPNAPVTIVEFSDFQCPFCRQFYDNAFAQINTDYIKTGKAKLVYRNFPLISIHPQADISANAAECANEQGKFWDMHDKMFQEQNKLDGGDPLKGPVRSTVTYSTDDLKKWAASISGIDTTKFNSCLDSKKYESQVQADLSEGSSVGVSGTPSFFVNGTPIIGAQGYDAFKSVIDSAIKQ